MRRVEFIGVPIAVLTMLLAQRLAARVGATEAGWVAVIPAPEIARIVIGVLAIFIGEFSMARQPRAIRTGGSPTRMHRMLPLGSAALVVAFITVANQYFGPGLAGAIGAFPTMTTTIALFIAHRFGVRHANSAMGGMVKSLPVYLTYCLVFALLILHTTVWWAVAGATALALVVARVTANSWVSRQARPVGATPRRRSTSGISARPARPFPSAKAWMVSN